MKSDYFYQLILSIFAAIGGFFAPVHYAMLYLLVIVTIDLLLGVFKSVKMGTFLWTKFYSFFVKLFIYLLCIAVGLCVDYMLSILGIGIVGVFIANYVIAALGISEFFSCLGKLDDLGIKIPYIVLIAKLKKAIPFIPTSIKNWTQDIVDEAMIILNDDKRRIYKDWMVYSECYLNEYIAKPTTDKAILDTKKERVRSRLFAKYNTSEHKRYINCLMKLYDECPPISQDNLYNLANLGLNLGTPKSKHNSQPKDDLSSECDKTK